MGCIVEGSEGKQDAGSVYINSTFTITTPIRILQISDVMLVCGVFSLPHWWLHIDGLIALPRGEQKWRGAVEREIIFLNVMQRVKVKNKF